MPPTSYARAAWLFLRLLGLVYLIAFWSLATQILGLAGHDGILPADRYMTAAHTLDGISRYWMLPTLTWISASDTFLRALCIGGAALAALLIAGILPALVLPLLWLAYLSLSVVCGEFLSFQWDALLLEAGFLAIFLAPWTVRERARAPADPPRLVVWLFLWLLFRLMVGSGAVKLTSGDATWRGLTALTVHFETQPIPTPFAWYAHWLPAWLLKASTVIVFAIELLVPMFIVTTRRLRRWAFVPLVALQIVIALTGNYAFFNLLTAALCVFLIDDAAWGAWGPGNPGGNIAIDHPTTSRARHAVVVALAVVIVPVSAVTFAGSLGIRIPGAVLVDPLADLVAPFRSVNAYGLFAVMTTTRPEIVIEGSDDGRDVAGVRVPIQGRRRPSAAAVGGAAPAAAGLADVVRRARPIRQRALVPGFLRPAAPGRWHRADVAGARSIRRPAAQIRARCALPISVCRSRDVAARARVVGSPADWRLLAGPVAAGPCRAPSPSP